MNKYDNENNRSTSVLYVDFQNQKQIYNPLEEWRQSLAKELEDSGYSSELDNHIFKSKPVSQAKNLYELNSEFQNLEIDQTIVLFRNHHFEIAFKRIDEDKTMILLSSILSGLDRALLQPKLEKEVRIIQKYYKQMQVLFCD